jgi:hypothetical protein
MPSWPLSLLICNTETIPPLTQDYLKDYMSTEFKVTNEEINIY